MMEKNDFRILLFRFHPYIAAGAETGAKQEVFCARKFSLYPPLGLAQLSSVLKCAGYPQVKLIDAWAEGLHESEFLKRVQDFDPHLVGCTLWTTNLNGELPILRRVKERIPKALTVVGGPHLDVYPRECLERAKFVDFGVAGEAEETIIELCEAVREDKLAFKDNSGIIFRDGTTPVFTGWRPPVDDLDSLPFPDFTDLPLDRYYSEHQNAAPYIYLFSARGCPYRCRYCFNSRGRTFRKHSVDYTIKYIKFLRDRHGIKETGFWDETFTFDKKRTLDFCSRYKEEDIGLPYTVRTRVNHVDEEILRALKGSGCNRIHYGVESGNQDVLDRMNRRMTLKQARNALALTKKVGIPVAINIMIGYLDESRQTYDRTIGFVKELNPDHVNIFITTVLPGTELYFEALKLGILEKDVWREYALGKIPSIDPKGLRLPGKDYSVDDLEKMLAEAHRRIYLSPAFIRKKLASIRSPRQLERHLAQVMLILANRLPRPLRESIIKSRL